MTDMPEPEALSQRLAEVEAAYEALVAEHHQNLIHGAVREAALGAGVDPAMLPFLVDHVAGRLSVHDGTVVALDESGAMATDEAGQPRSVAEVLADMRRNGTVPAPFFRGAGGGGAPGSGEPAAPGLANPWAAESFNLTRQGELMRQNPQLARVLAQQAGG